jgi:hypothetical protein
LAKSAVARPGIAPNSNYVKNILMIIKALTENSSQVPLFE